MRSPVTGQKHMDKYTGFFLPRKYEKQNHPKNRDTEDRYYFGDISEIAGRQKYNYHKTLHISVNAPVYYAAFV